MIRPPLFVSAMLFSIGCLGAAPAVDLVPATTARCINISDTAWAGSSVNVVANSRQALFTSSRTQFAAYYDADGTMVLAKRALGADTWEMRRSNFKGNVADAHNSISLVVDGAGFVHVAWDHHGNPLNYARSVAPGSLELGSKRSMTGTLEKKSLIRNFFSLPMATCCFFTAMARRATARSCSAVIQRPKRNGPWFNPISSTVKASAARIGA